MSTPMTEAATTKRFTVDRRISVGTIVTLLVLAIGGFASYKDLEAQVAVLETKQTRTQEDYKQLDQKLDKVLDKLEGLREEVARGARRNN